MDIINYLLVLLLFAGTIYYSRRQTRGALRGWYNHLKKPSWSLSGEAVRQVWVLVILLTGFAILWFWNVPAFGIRHYIVGALLLINGVLYIRWNKTLYVQHHLHKAYKESLVLTALTAVTVIIIFSVESIGAVLMLPYLLWLAYFTQLTKEIQKHN